MAEPPPFDSVFALDTFATMVLDGASVSAEYRRMWDTMPFSTLHVVYLTIVGQIKYTSNFKETSLEKNINITKSYLKYWEGRWKISCMSLVHTVQ
jgi:hypothetical protein